MHMYFVFEEPPTSKVAGNKHIVYVCLAPNTKPIGYR
jgi:hypothetical protein